MPIESGIWSLGGALLGAAMVLWRYAFFGRRVGDTPFCRKCRYNLTGVTIDEAAARCPECGVELATRLPLRGVRPRRMGWRIAFAATLLLAIGSLTLGITQVAGRIKPIEYVPESWLVARVEAGAASAVPALAELRQREALMPLKSVSVARLIANGLRVQGLPTLGPAAPAIIDDLSRRLLQGHLSDAEVDVFVKQAVRPVSLKTRSEVPAGRPFALRAEFQLRMGQSLGISTDWPTVTCDGVELKSQESGEGRVPTYFWGVAGGQHICDSKFFMSAEPGPRTLTFSCTYKMSRLGAGTDRGGTLTMESAVNVVAQLPDHEVSGVSGAAKDRDVADRHFVTYRIFPTPPDDRPLPAAWPNAQRLYISVDSGGAVNTHFAIVGELNGRLARIPNYISNDARDPATRGSSMFGIVTPIRFDRVYLVADRRGAYLNTLYEEIWDGVLVFDPVADSTLNTPRRLGDPPPCPAPRVEPPWSAEKLAAIPRQDEIPLDDWTK
ncbi:MAG: hypothetical protein SF069_01075 [Phycisphaerae bacterium]|nr:hypothetical protein [Phycisphaerae bacterium]